MVDEDASTPEAQPTDPAARRERIIQNLLSKQTVTGIRVGIWAAQACQICGGIDTFSGFVLAMAVHVGRYYDFVCSTCRSGRAPEGRLRNLDEGCRRAAGIMATQAHRFCERCQTRLEPFEPHRLGSFWVCPACLQAIGGTVEAVRILARRRYLALEYPTDEALRAFDLAMETMVLDLEETVATGKDRARLEAERPARARAMLGRLGRVHGAEYAVSEPASRRPEPPSRMSADPPNPDGP